MARGTVESAAACAVLVLILQVVGSGVEAHSGHSHDQKFDKSMQTAVNDTEHIQEHLQEDLGMNVSTANMTTEELAYYYFRLHDQDGNSQLDGLEMLKGWSHYMEQENTTVTKEIWDTLVDSVDGILKKEDRNNNGLLDYGEYQRLLHSSKP